MPKLNVLTSEKRSPKHRRAYHLAFSGIISGSTLEAFREALAEPAASALDLLIDLREVKYIGSAGFGEIVRVADDLSLRDRHLFVISPGQDQLALMRMLGLTEVLRVYEDLPSALEALDRPEAIPQADAPAPAPPPPEAAKRTGPRLPEARILIGITEESRFIQFLRRCLSDPERPAEIARDRREVAAILGKHPPDVAILDGNMPDLNEITSMLKTDPAVGLCPVITYYTHNVDGTTVHTFRVMEDDYVVEPFEVREILALIESEYERSHERGDLLRQEAHLRIPSDTKDILEATQTLENLLESVPLEENARNAYLYALREAIDNARRHGNNESPDKEIDVLFALEERQVAVTVGDEGEGFDYPVYISDASSYTPVEQARLRHRDGEQGGLGINLMLRCADRVEYFPPGNRVRLFKKF
jgi:serine/threonine-protein kinase RsbW